MFVNFCEVLNYDFCRYHIFNMNLIKFLKNFKDFLTIMVFSDASYLWSKKELKLSLRSEVDVCSFFYISLRQREG